MVHHDLWEYDNVGPPTLGDITVNGRRIKAVIQPNKNGFLYVLDRTNGKPVWPIDRAAGAEVDGAGRAHVADAALPDQAAGVRSPGFHRRRI